MKLEELPLSGAFIIDPRRFEDERGFFAASFTIEAFEERGLETRWAQFSISYNRARGTVRGMHLQKDPFAEVKLVRCTAGAVHDVLLDLRPDSPTFRRWAATELTAGNRRLLYIPKGLAHGFQTLEEGSELAYQVSAPYRPEAAIGVRWDDPAFDIRWPLPVSVISERDRLFADFGGPPTHDGK
jgi:dTDP-4-dehydrorhamnose 3,5-epimerase